MPWVLLCAWLRTETRTTVCRSLLRGLHQTALNQQDAAVPSPGACRPFTICSSPTQGTISANSLSW